MANKVYAATALIGGAAGALDAIDGVALVDKDMAFVIDSGIFRAYILDVDSALVEASPTVIAPDTNAGDKRWILQNTGGVYVSNTAYEAGWDADTTVAPSKNAVYDKIETLYPTLVGEVKMWPTETVPSGYLECNGASLIRADYANLFAVIGTLYGAADGTHFNLPDYRGRFPRAWAHGQADDPDRLTRTVPVVLGATIVAGDHVGTEQVDGFKAHTHTYSGTFALYGAVALGSSVLTNLGAYSTTTSTGGLETRPVNTNIMFIIKY